MLIEYSYLKILGAGNDTLIVKHCEEEDIPKPILNLIKNVSLYFFIIKGNLWSSSGGVILKEPCKILKFHV